MIKFIKANKWSILSTLCAVMLAFVGGGVMMADAVTVVHPGNPKPTEGQAGLKTQVPGEAVTVSNMQEAGGELIQPEIDDQITMIATDESPLDTIKRRCKRQVQVNSFEVDHYMIDEKRVAAKNTAAVAYAAGTPSFQIQMSAADQKIFYPYSTATVKGVKGYVGDGVQENRTNEDLMLFCIKADKGQNPTFIAVNGPRESKDSPDTGTPEIPIGSEITLLGSAGYETQEQIRPSMITPVPERRYLQKQLCNSIVSDYFEAQKKRIPFQKAQIAEAIVRQWRLENSRTAWVGVQSKFKVQALDETLGEQNVYTSKGIKWDIKRVYELPAGPLTFETLNYLMMFKFTGYNCSRRAIWLMGKELLANIQKIDFTLHKDIAMADSEVYGMKCRKLSGVFGDIELIHDPTLDRLGYSKSGALLEEEGLVRYWRKNETTKTEKVEGEEAQREIVMCIDALCLKGFSHIWVDGENTTSGAQSDNIKITQAASLPVKPVKNQIVILTAQDSEKTAGSMWQWDGEKWVAYDGSIIGDIAKV